MRDIQLNASVWEHEDDFYNSLLSALEAPEWHGPGLNALIDSMIWGGINAVEPPYKIQIIASRRAPRAVIQEIDLAKRALDKARMDFVSRKGYSPQVEFEILS